MRQLLGVLVAVVVSISTVCVCIPLYVFGCVRLVVPSAAFRRWIAYPMDRVIDAWVSVFRGLISALRLIDIQTEFDVDLDDRSKWRVLVCNHQSWVDIIVLQTSFRKSLPVLKFFTKKELIWVPFIGVAMWFLGFPYVYRSKSAEQGLTAERRESNETVLEREGARFLEKPVAVINFVEGTRFSPAKRDQRNSPFNNLLLPRRGGFIRTMQVLGDRVDTVLNVTIVYEDQIPGFWDLLCGRTTSARLIVSEVDKPSDDDGATTDWLMDLWREKDELLKNEYTE